MKEVTDDLEISVALFTFNKMQIVNIFHRALSPACGGGDTDAMKCFIIDQFHNLVHGWVCNRWINSATINFSMPERVLPGGFTAGVSILTAEATFAKPSLFKVKIEATDKLRFFEMRSLPEKLDKFKLEHTTGLIGE